MTLTFLGTGTSGGVPALGCNCPVCHSSNPKDKRFRTAALLEAGQTHILIDSGPDIRMQLLPLPFKPLDGVLITHIHYDHVAGIDDLRPFCVFGDINIYCNEQTKQGLMHNMPYCFTPKLYPGVPRLNLHTVENHVPFKIRDVEITPITVMHDRLPIFGYRIGKLTYITDMKSIADEEMPYLRGTDTLVVNALRWRREHHSHMLVDEAIEFAHKVGPRCTYFVHMTHEIGFHDEANKKLPAGFQFAYDGLKIDI